MDYLWICVHTPYISLLIMQRNYWEIRCRRYNTLTVPAMWLAWGWEMCLCVWGIGTEWKENVGAIAMHAYATRYIHHLHCTFILLLEVLKSFGDSCMELSSPNWLHSVPSIIQFSKYIWAEMGNKTLWRSFDSFGVYRGVYSNWLLSHIPLHRG